MECTHASGTELLSDSRAGCHSSGLAMCTRCAIRVSNVHAVRRQVPNTGAGGVQPAARPVEVQLGRRLRAVPQDPGGPGPGGRLLPANRPPGTRNPALAYLKHPLRAHSIKHCPCRDLTKEVGSPTVRLSSRYWVYRTGRKSTFSRPAFRKAPTWVLGEHLVANVESCTCA